MIGLIGPIGWSELLLLVILLVILFGGRKIPELARGLGEGIRNFRQAIRGDDADGKPGQGGDTRP